MRYYTSITPDDTAMGYSLLFEPHREEWVCHGVFIYHKKHYLFHGSLSLYQAGNDCDAFFAIEEGVIEPLIYEKLMKCINEHTQWLSLNWCYQTVEDIIMLLNQDPAITRETLQQWRAIGDLSLPFGLCQKETSIRHEECGILL